MATRYVPKFGAKITERQAQFIGEVAERHGGLQAEDAARALVRASKAKTAPTHARLWGKPDRVLAADWRRREARILLGQIEYVVREATDDAPAHTAKAVTHLPPTETETGGYFPTAAVVASPPLRERAEAELERRLKVARMIVGAFADLVEIVDAAAAALARARKRRAKKIA